MFAGLWSSSGKKNQDQNLTVEGGFAGKVGAGTVQVGWGKVKIRAAHEVSEGKVFMGSKKRLARFHFATWLELRRGEASCHRELEVGDTGGSRMVCCSSEKRRTRERVTQWSG